jgi:hypothetical protein
MKHLIRIALIFLLLCVLSVAGTIVSVRVIFPPAKVIRYIQDGSLGFIGRAVKIGSLSYGLKGMDIRGFSLSNPPDFSAGTFLSLDNVHIGYARHPWRPRVTGSIGALSFEGTVRRASEEHAIVFDDLRIRTGNSLLLSSGTVSGLRDTNTMRYTFQVSGDRVVLDRVLELFPALAAFQYGDTPKVRFVIEGSPEGIRISRK